MVRTAALPLPSSPHAPLKGGSLSAPVLVSMAVLCAAALLTAFVIALSGLHVKTSDFTPIVALAGGLWLLAGYSRYRQLDPRFAHAAAILATGTLSLLICGLISNVGLRLRAPLVDGALARADAFFGWDVSHAVPAFASHAWLIDGLARIYNLSGPLVAACILAILVTGRTRKAWELLVTTVVAMQVIAAISIMLPARGAMAHFDLLYLQGNGLPAGAGVYHLSAFDHLHAGTDPRFGIDDMSGLVTFPSFHTVLGLLIAQALAGTRFHLLGIVTSAAVIVSTIPIGGHYVTDILAGTLIWLVAAVIALRADRSPGARLPFGPRTREAALPERETAEPARQAMQN